MSLPATTSDDTGTTPGDNCPACPHPMSAHDPISARFCVATAGGGYSRGCVCTPVPMTPQTAASRR